MSADAKHSADRPSLDGQLADAARDREQILAELLAADIANHAVKRKGWTVVRQYCEKGDVVEHAMCRHRFERVAEWCARRRAWRHTATGGHYTVRRAKS